MDAMTLYISILTTSYLVGLIFCLYVKASPRILLMQLVQCAASVWIATLMPEWMIWTSCALMLVSLITTAYAVVKYDLVEVYETALK